MHVVGKMKPSVPKHAAAVAQSVAVPMKFYKAR
jgi:hypothetical protein